MNATYTMIYDWIADAFGQANADAALPYADESFCVTHEHLLFLTAILNLRWAGS